MRLPRAVEWVRVSSDGQEEAGTPAAQHHALDRLLEQRPAEVVERVDIGKGISGALPLGERPDVQRVQALIEAGGVNELRVVALDRITRADSLDDRLHVLLLCSRHGVVIVEAGGRVIDPAEDLGAVEYVMRSAWARQERLRIRERTVGGRQRVAREGKWAGGAVPFGFVLESDGTVRLDDTATDLIRRIFSEVAAGDPCSTVAKRLNAENIASPRGGRWMPRRIIDMIRRRAFLGELTQTQGGESFKVEVPALIDEGVWRAANRAIDGRAKWGGRPPKKSTSLLRGLARCGVCGGSTYTAHNHYVCRSYHDQMKYGPWCGLPRLPVEATDEAVWNELSRLISDPAVLSAALAPQTSPDVSSWQSQVERCESELERLAKVKDDWLRLTRRGLLDMETLEKHLRSVEADSETLRRTAETAREAIRAEEDAARAAADVSAMLPDLARTMHLAQEADRRSVVEILVPKLPGYGVHLQKDGSCEIVGALPVPPEFTKVGAQS